MSAIRLYRSGTNEWVFDHQGSQHAAVLSSVETNDTFRSIGLHPKGAVMISVNPTGLIEKIALVDDTPLEELVIPPTHGLWRDLRPV